MDSSADSGSSRTDQHADDIFSLQDGSLLSTNQDTLSPSQHIAPALKEAVHGTIEPPDLEGDDIARVQVSLGEMRLVEAVAVANDDWDDASPFDSYLPSISDNLKVSVYSKDCATITEESDIVELKALSTTLITLDKDINELKKELLYAKRTMQAEYEGKLRDISFELYKQANQRIVEIEKIQEERVKVVRRSYKTQLSDAICKLSRDYHRFYGNKTHDAEESHTRKLKELEKAQQVQKQNELAQKDMMEMMQMQVESALSKEDPEPVRPDSVESITPYVNEISELKESLHEVESRLEYVEDMLEETNAENSRLGIELEEVNGSLREETSKREKLEAELMKLQKTLGDEREASKAKLAAQKEKLLKEMEERLNNLKKKMKEETQRELNEARQEEGAKMHRMKMAEEKRISELVKKQEETVRETSAKPVVEADTTKLMEMEQKQRAEIARLHREMDRASKTWEMKVTILQNTMHALKDEMFLRSSLQRQSAKLQHAAITYASEGPMSHPVGILPTAKGPSPLRRHQLPNIVQAPQAPPSTLDTSVKPLGLDQQSILMAPHRTTTLNASTPHNTIASPLSITTADER